MAPNDLRDLLHAKPFPSAPPLPSGPENRVVLKNGERSEVGHDLDLMPLPNEIDPPLDFNENNVPWRGVHRRREDIERLVPWENEEHRAA